MVFKNTYSDYIDTIFLHYFLTSHIPQEVVYIIIRTVICVSAVNLGSRFGLKLLYLQYIHCTVAAGELQILLSDAVDKFSKLEDINKLLVCGTFCKERRATSDPGYIDKPET